jgi:hypothetical protein
MVPTARLCIVAAWLWLALGFQTHAEPWKVLKPELFLADLKGVYLDPEGRSVVIGERGIVGRSKNLVDWSVEQFYPDERYIDVAYGNGIFVRVGSIWLTDGTQRSAIWFSRDGAHWVLVEDGSDFPYPLDRVAYGNGRFVIPYKTQSPEGLSVCLVSTDGEHWTPSKARERDIETFGSLHFSDGLFRGCNYGGALFASEDGTHWKKLSPGQGNTYQYGMAQSGGTWVTVNAVGDIRWSKNDGTNWGLVRLPAVRGLYDVAAADGIFIAVGKEGKVLRSTNGENWTLESTDVGVILEKIQREGGLWWAFGMGGVILTSPDGQTWKTRIAPAPNLLSVAGGDQGFVAVGPDARGYSKDGLTWEFVKATNLQSVAYGNGIFVANSDVLMISTNGLDWRTVDFGENFARGRLVFGKDQFLFLMDGGFQNIGFVSTNGLDWEEKFHFSTWILSDLVGSDRGFFASDTFTQSAGFLDDGQLSQYGPWGGDDGQGFAAIAVLKDGLVFFSEQGAYGYGFPPPPNAENSTFLGYPLIHHAHVVARHLFLAGGGSEYTRSGFLPQLWQFDGDGFGYAIDTMPYTTRLVRSMATDGRSGMVAVGSGLMMYHRLDQDFLDTPKLHVESDGKSTQIWFYSAPGFFYTLEYSRNLRDWTSEPQSPDGTYYGTWDIVGGITKWRLPSTRNESFFRVLVE